MNLLSDSVKNAHLFRRITSSIIASVFGLSFGICSVKPAKAEEVKRFKFCDQHKSLFHLNSGAKRKVRVAVFDVEGNYNEPSGKGTYQFQGHSDILASELIKENNFAVVNWGQIKPTYSNPDIPGNKLEAQKLITLKKLHEIRDEHGVEAVLIGTVNQFYVNGQHTRKILGFGKTTKNNEVYIKLNFRVIDITTGEIVLTAEGNGHSSKSYTDVTIPKINVNITKEITKNFNTTDSWNTTKNDSITFTINIGSEYNRYYH